jgi:hypothetical protein
MCDIWSLGRIFLWSILVYTDNDNTLGIKGNVNGQSLGQSTKYALIDCMTPAFTKRKERACTYFDTLLLEFMEQEWKDSRNTIYNTSDQRGKDICK